MERLGVCKGRQEEANGLVILTISPGFRERSKIARLVTFLRYTLIHLYHHAFTTSRAHWFTACRVGYQAVQATRHGSSALKQLFYTGTISRPRAYVLPTAEASCDATSGPLVQITMPD